MYTGWEQPHWFSAPGHDAGYKPSFRRTNWFGPVGEECDMVMTRAGVIDLTPFGKIQVSGPDAVKYMDHICANVVPKVHVFGFRQSGPSMQLSNFSTSLKTIGSNYFSMIFITYIIPVHFLFGNEFVSFPLSTFIALVKDRSDKSSEYEEGS